MNSVLVTKVSAGKGSGSSLDTKKTCDFYSRREFGSLFLVETYQRCVRNRNAMYIILLWQNFGILFYPWTVEQDLWLFISSYLGIFISLSKKKKHSFLHSTFPSSQKLQFIQHMHNHTIIIKAWLSSLKIMMVMKSKKGPQRQFHCLRTHANVEHEWNLIWLSKKLDLYYDLTNYVIQLKILILPTIFVF